jgi:hypothetical protein
LFKLGQRHDGVGQVAFLDQPTKPQAVELHRGDVAQHPDQFVLHQLEIHPRLAELVPLFGVRQGRVVRPDRVAERPPGDRVPGGCQHLGRVLERVRGRQLVVRRNPHLGHLDVSLPNGSRRALALDHLGDVAGRGLLHQASPAWTPRKVPRLPSPRLSSM